MKRLYNNKYTYTFIDIFILQIWDWMTENRKKCYLARQVQFGHERWCKFCWEFWRLPKAINTVVLPLHITSSCGFLQGTEPGLIGVSGALVILWQGGRKEEGSVIILLQALVGLIALDLQLMKNSVQVYEIAKLGLIFPIHNFDQPKPTLCEGCRTLWAEKLWKSKRIHQPKPTKKTWNGVIWNPLSNFVIQKF